MASPLAIARPNTHTPAPVTATNPRTDLPAPDPAMGDRDPVFDIAQIQELLPHRYPFLLVDRIVEFEPEQRIVGYKNVTVNESFFQGHFPGRPIMPGVLIVEAMAQVGGIVLMKMPGAAGRLALFAGIDSVRFRRPVVPGDRLFLSAQLLSIKRQRIGKMMARADVNGQLVASGELMFSLVD